MRLIVGVGKIAEMIWIWEVLSHGLPLPYSPASGLLASTDGQPLAAAPPAVPLLSEGFSAPEGKPQDGTPAPPADNDPPADFFKNPSRGESSNPSLYYWEREID